MMAWAKRLPPFVMLLLAIGFIIEARGFKTASAIVPTLIGWCVLVLSSLDLASRFDGAVGRLINRVFVNNSDAVHAIPPVSGARQAIAVAGLAALVVGFFVIGVLPSCVIFVFLAMKFGARTGWIAAILSAIAVPLILWAMFTGLLGLEMPWGMVFEDTDP